MSTDVTFRLKCNCGAVLTAKSSMAGKRARCKKCCHTFTIPEHKQLKANNSATTASAADHVADCISDGQLSERHSLWDDFARNDPISQKDATSSSATKVGSLCPDCAAMMGDGIVCMQCGYHTKFKRKLKSLDSESIAKSKWVIFLTMLPLCLIYVIATIFTLDSMDGPMFLLFFFVGVCAFGVLTPLLRSLWLDTDIFNWLAVATLEGAGLIRIYNAMLESNYKISFLLLGMVVVPLVFLLPQTENSNEFSEPFRSKKGGLALVPYSLLFTSAVAVLALVYFVPPVSHFMAMMSFFPAIVAGIFTFSTLNASLLNRLPATNGSRYWGDSSFGGGGGCGGCGGGGCGGGGCGG